MKTGRVFGSTIDRIWLALLAATAITFALGESGVAGSGQAWPVPLMFALSFGKGLWVALDYMELRHAPRVWRRLVVGWLVAVVALIVLAWWAAR